MSYRKRLLSLMFAATIIMPCIANAAVVFPALDIQDMGADTGASLTTDSITDTFVISATAFTIVADIGPDIDIADQAFTLTATRAAGPGFFTGDFEVGGGLLTGTFINLALTPTVGGFVDFEADLSYTGGSLMGGFTGGRIEGFYMDAIVEAKLGTVVPVPAAVWLFGSGILGLVSVARRKKDIQ